MHKRKVHSNTFCSAGIIYLCVQYSTLDPSRRAGVSRRISQVVACRLLNVYSFDLGHWAESILLSLNMLSSQDAYNKLSKPFEDTQYIVS